MITMKLTQIIVSTMAVMLFTRCQPAKEISKSNNDNNKEISSDNSQNKEKAPYSQTLDADVKARSATNKLKQLNTPTKE